MLVVGLTGGIGSGKSSLAAELAADGVPVIDADDIARRCVAPGSAALAEIAARFGPGVIAPDGTLDRPALADVVFVDPEARRDLESITHPCIRDAIAAEIESLRASVTAPLMVVVEHPLLVETGGHRRVDRVVVVEAPIEQRIARLVSDRGMTEAAARDRIAAQTDDAARRAVADHVVMNDGTPVELVARAARLLAVLVTDAEASR